MRYDVLHKPTQSFVDSSISTHRSHGRNHRTPSNRLACSPWFKHLGVRDIPHVKVESPRLLCQLQTDMGPCKTRHNANVELAKAGRSTHNLVDRFKRRVWANFILVTVTGALFRLSRSATKAPQGGAQARGKAHEGLGANLGL